MKFIQSILCLGLIAAAGLMLSSCGRNDATSRGTSGGGVAATIWPMASLTQQLVGEDVTVACLLPPGLSPHGFEPTAKQMRELSDAKLLVTVGMGLDHWALAARKATGRKDLPMFVFAEAVGIHGGQDGEHEHAHEHEHEQEEGDQFDAAVQVGINEHLWMDPVLVMQMLPKLAAELEAALPDHKAAIKANLAKLLGELNQLDADLRTGLATVPNRQLVTFHDAFNRLAQRYGLTVVATLMPIETPGGVSADRIEQVLDALNRYHLKVVFAEPQFSSQAADTLANEAHIHVLLLDPLGDPHDAQRDTYQRLMRYNLGMLVQGLSRL